jgi:hypothetical protein
VGIFGSLDIDTIPDNPYWVEAGEYQAIISNAFFEHNEKRNQDQLVIAYTIMDQDSKYFNFEVRDWFDYYPDIDEDGLSAMNPAERKDVVSALSAIKRRLCGQPDQGRVGLGVDPTELDENWNPEILIDKQVNLAVVNGGKKNEYTNVKWANLVE